MICWHGRGTTTPALRADDSRRMILRADDRYATSHPGVETRHAFSAGAHYDPDDVAFGPVVGCDEHLVGPGGGFDWHAHRGVVIVSWVLSGTLRHEDDGGGELLVPPGDLLVQSCGDGIRHRETNASGTERLRFVQTTLLLDLERSVGPASPPVRVGDVTIDVRPGGTLQPGDTSRDGRTFAAASGDAELVLSW